MSTIIFFYTRDAVCDYVALQSSLLESIDSWALCTFTIACLRSALLVPPGLPISKVSVRTASTHLGLHFKICLPLFQYPLYIQYIQTHF